MQVLLHIGTHKTGSTVIQSALAHSAPKLIDDGILFIPSSVLRRCGDLMSAELPDSELAGDLRRDFLGFLDSASLSTPGLCVISYEGFSGSLKRGYTNSDVVAKVLRETFKGFNVSICCYLRSQDSFIESVYTQIIHQGGSLSLEQFLDSLPAGSYDWHRLICGYEQCFGEDKVFIRPYHPELLPLPNSILDDFGQLIGTSKLLAAVGSEEVNRGYSAEALAYARLLNPALNAAERVLLRQVLQRLSPKPRTSSYSYLPTERRESIQLMHRDSNDSLSVRKVGKPWPDFMPTWSSDESTHMVENSSIESMSLAMLSRCLEVVEKQSLEAVKSKDRMSEAKSKIKELEKRLEDLQKNQAKMVAFGTSLAGRLGQILYSVEKRIRGTK